MTERGSVTGRGIALLAGACCAALTAGAAMAQQEADTAPEAPRRTSDISDTVVVIGTRTEQLIQNIPAMISVITAEEIEETIATDIKDLVRFEPGVSVRSSPSRFGAALGTTGRDGNAGFNIRGLEGNRVLIQTDGIRLPDSFAFGAQSVGRGDYVDLDLLKSVEILRGPASALYGSDGLAGAVSFVTKDPDDMLAPGRNFGARGRVAYASADNSWAESVALAGRSGAWQTMLTYTRRDGHEQENQGTNESLDSSRTAPNPADAESNALLGKIVYAPSSIHRLRLTGEYFDSDVRTEVFTARGPTVLDLDARDESERSRVSLDYSYDNPGQFIDRAFAVVYYQDATTLQFSDEDRDPAADRTRINTFDNRVWGASGQIEAGFATGGAKHRILLGGDFSQTRQQGVRDGTVPPAGEAFPIRAFPVTDYMLAGVFLQDEISLANGRVLLYPALRFDAYDLEPNPDPSFPFPSAPQDDSRLSPKFGAVAWATEHVGVFANYAAGFKAPSPSQVNNGFANPAFGYASLPNPDLGPETSDSFEAGLRLRDLRGAGADWTASASAFTAQFKDFIEQVVVSGSFTPMDPAIYQFVNLSEVDISGAEARLEGRWDNGVGLIASASYAHGEQDGGAGATPLQSIDPWKLVAGLSYDDPAGRFGGQLIATHSSGKDDDDVAENQAGNAAADLFTPPGFTVVDVTAYWRLTDAATLRLAVFNLFDDKYWWWSDVRGVAATSPVVDAYTQPGRNFNASLVLRF